MIFSKKRNFVALGTYFSIDLPFTHQTSRKELWRYRGRVEGKTVKNHNLAWLTTNHISHHFSSSHTPCNPNEDLKNTHILPLACSHCLNSCVLSEYLLTIRLVFYISHQNVNILRAGTLSYSPLDVHHFTQYFVYIGRVK